MYTCTHLFKYITELARNKESTYVKNEVQAELL